MKRAWRLLVAIVLLGAAFLTGAWVSWRATSAGHQVPGRKVLYWVDPMHPSYRSDRAGTAPDCGMPLEPVYADQPAAATSAPMAGTVTVDADKRQVIGVQTGVVEQGPMERVIRTVGRVVPDENRVYRLVTTSDGWVKEVVGGQTGTVVAKNQVLLTFYNREFLSAQAAYFFALDALNRFRKDPGETPTQIALTQTQVRAAAETLQALGMDEIQLAEIATTRKAATDIVLRAPVSGYVVSRNVYPRQRFEKSTELYRIVDASQVWILAELFESDAEFVRPGDVAHISLPYQQHAPAEAKVADALPQFDPETRTLKLRLEADNRGYALRPDMLVDVQLRAAMPSALMVPADAVVDSGGRQTVFVELGEGRFEARTVRVGRRVGDRVEIRQGLAAGERIVLSGNFLLDSESRMKTAAMGLAADDRDPVCGMAIDREKARTAGKLHVYHGDTYYFCSDECLRRFTTDPQRYVGSDAPRAASRSAFRIPPLPEPTSDKPRAEVSASASTIPAAGSSRARMRSRTPRLLLAPPAPVAQARSANDATIVAAGNVPAVPSPPQKTSLDPVNGLPVEEESAAAAGLTTSYKGTTYYFSSGDCKKKFEAEPEKYVVRK